MKAILLTIAAVAAGLTIHRAKPTVGVLVGEIVPGGLAPLVSAVDARREGDVFSLYINSGGGIVAEAKTLMVAVEAAKARGADIQCYAMDATESAAFWIFVHCSERYALPQSILMFHHIRITHAEDVSAADAARMQAELQQLDDEYLDDISEVCDASRSALERWMDRGDEWTPAAMDREMPGVLTAIQASYPIRIRFLLPVETP